MKSVKMSRTYSQGGDAPAFERVCQQKYIPMPNLDGKTKIVATKVFKRVLVAAALLWTLPIAVLPGQSIKTGPEVGQQVPGFSAKDQEGRDQTLKSVMGPHGAMLVFFRSADW